MQNKSNLMKWYLVAFVVLCFSMLSTPETFAVTATPIDLTATVADILAWVLAAAATAVGLFGAMVGIRYIIRVFKSVK